MNLFKKISLVALASVFVLSAGANSVAQAKETVSGKITVNGSTALLPLTLQAAKEFKKKNPKVMIAASGAGSVTGPQAVRKGVANIGACDWDASTDVPGFKKFDGQVATPIAVIPFAAVVNKNVGVDSLTNAQLKDIFSGKIKNWKDVGGKDADIIVVTRAFGSGTRVNFQQKALEGGDIGTGSNFITAATSGNMKTTVETKENSIGYIDLVYVSDKMKALKINNVEPTIDNVINGKYKVWGYGYYMTKGEPTGATKAFIDYITSKTFQEGSLKKMKFIPVSAMKK